MVFLYGLVTSLAVLSLLEALYSLKDGFRHLRFFRRRKDDRPGNFVPRLTLVVPFRGVDPGLEDNLRAYCRLDYPDWQLLLVTSDAGDTSVPVLEHVLADFPGLQARVLFAGESRNRSQKIQNLLYALESLRGQDDVIAFGDSDIRPRRDWLRFLVAPLVDPRAGVSTGFRWYLPPDSSFASVLRSVWNAGISSLMKEWDSGFAWGGAMAVRREVFDTCNVVGYWSEALSDDYALSRAVHDAGLSIRFQPQCLSFSYENSTFRTLLEWTYRQLLITRVCVPKLWGVAFVAQFFNVLTVWGGGLLLLLTAVLNLETEAFYPPLLAGILGAVYVLGCFKGALRLKAVTLLFPEESSLMKPYRWAYIFWGPLASLLSLVGMVRASFSRTIEWRGIRYRMVAPNRTVVVD